MLSVPYLFYTGNVEMTDIRLVRYIKEMEAWHGETVCVIYSLTSSYFIFKELVLYTYTKYVFQTMGKCPTVSLSKL